MSPTLVDMCLAFKTLRAKSLGQKATQQAMVKHGKTFVCVLLQFFQFCQAVSIAALMLSRMISPESSMLELI